MPEKRLQERVEERRPRVVFIPGIDGSPHSGDRVLELLVDSADCAQFMFPISRPGPKRLIEPTYFPGSTYGGFEVHGGPTAKQANHSLSSMADAIAAWMRQMSWDSAMIIGESYGGAVAQTLALNHPSLVTRLALVSSFTRHPARVYGGVLGPALRVLPRWSLKVPIMMVSSLTVLRGIERSRRKKYYQRTFEMPFDDIGRRIKSLKPFASRDFQRESQWPRTMWLWGERERLVDFEQESRWIRTNHPNDSVVIIEGAGHVIPATQREVLCAHLRSFFGLGHPIAVPVVSSP